VKPVFSADANHLQWQLKTLDKNHDFGHQIPAKRLLSVLLTLKTA